jgi:hypothetical protein
MRVYLVEALSIPIARKFFQPVAGWDAQIV